MGRHRTLRANLEKLVATGHIAQPPAEFWPLFEEVTERIKDFRDDYLAHTHHARLMESTLLRFEEEAPRIHLGVMFPKEGEVLDVTSEPLDDLLPLIETVGIPVARLPRAGAIASGDLAHDYRRGRHVHERGERRARWRLDEVDDSQQC